MKIVLSIITAALVFTSCSSVYRSGQTPDDVYFSPDRPQSEEYVRVDNDDDRQYQYRRGDDRVSRYDDRNDYYDDRYLRMRVRNRRMWSDLDFYYNDPYAFNYYPNRFGAGFGFYNMSPYSYWNPYATWNYYHNPYSIWNNYNPYYSPYYNKVIVVNPRNQVYSRPRTFNLNTFNNPNVPVNRSPQVNQNATRGNRSNNVYYNTDRNRNSGGSLRDWYQGSNSNNNNRSYNNNNNSGRSYDTPSSSGRSSGSSSNNSGGSSNRSGGSAPARRF